MKKTFLILCGLIVLASFAWGAPSEPEIYIEAGGSSVIWAIDGFDYGMAQLTVTGPRKIVGSQTVDRGERPKFVAVDDTGRAIDGTYTWNLTVRSYLSDELLEAIAKERLVGEEKLVCELEDEGILQSFNFSGTFVQIDGKVVLPVDEFEKHGATDLPTKDFVILDDLIVVGSACIGFDCVNGESFGFDTIRLKENNLRIKFDDTSTLGSYPRNDWQLTANDSANGGASKFSIDDISNGRTPFTVEAQAPSHSLYVDDGGRIGLGTATPVVDLHVVSGNTPTLRLEQNGSSGFTPQTWDVAGNETSFFIRDATNGSTLPFRIRPGAGNSSLVIDDDNNIGIGLLSPDGDSAVHIRRNDNSAQLRVESTGEAGNADMIYLENDGKVTIRTVNSDAGATWDFSNDNNFNISSVGTGFNELSLSSVGNLQIRGSLIAQGGDGSTDPGDTFPDYVFAPNYELMSIEDLEAFVTTNRHLPNVPSAEDISEAGGINMTQLQLRLLEKVEELALYTISQEKTMRSQDGAIQAQAEVIRRLTERLDALEVELEH